MSDKQIENVSTLQKEYQSSLSDMSTLPFILYPSFAKSKTTELK